MSHDLKNPIITKFIRIIPISWQGYISLRAEFYGCREGKCYYQLRNVLFRRQDSNPGHIGRRRLPPPLRHPCFPNNPSSLDNQHFPSFFLNITIDVNVFQCDKKDYDTRPILLHDAFGIELTDQSRQY